MQHKLYTTRKALISLLLSLCLLLGSLPALAAANAQSEDFAREVQALVSRHWPHIKNLWPGCDYEQHRLVLMYVDDAGQPRQAWLLGTEGMKTLEAPAYQALEAPQPGGYSAITIESSPAIAMSFDDASLKQPGEAEQVYRTATHELVHFYHQDAFTGQEGGSRAQAYPLNPAPRYLRMMIYQNLITALEQPEHRSLLLGQARFWLDRWHKEFPEESEAIRGTDIVEGAARYIENMGAVVKPDLSAEAQLKEAMQAIERDVLFTAADEESYELGYVAALLLDQTMPDWKEGFYEKNLAPAELLLQGVKPIEQTQDEGIWEQVQSEAEAVNQETAPQLQDILAAQADTSIPYLKIDVTKAAGSYEARGNYMVNQADVITGFSAAYKAGDGSIMIRNTSVISLHTEEDQGFILLPLTMVHTVKDGVLEIQSKDVVVEQVQVDTLQEGGWMVYHAVVGTNTNNHQATDNKSK
ncbi:MAG: hypothetical protein GX611_05750 [Clostridiales bacterium]|mgnify:CR=1 FL=1|nr:hypothetical protein [Clostridiales bacterium]